MALAHTLGSKVEASYNRGDLLEKKKGADAGMERLFSKLSYVFSPCLPRSQSSGISSGQ
jgi:hypothetical protein